MRKPTQEDIVELVASLPGVEGISSEDGEIFIHVQDNETRNRVGEKLKNLREGDEDEEGIDCTNVRIRQ